jgi:hypothetical protein
MRCPQCKNKVLQKSESGTKLRTKGAITFKADGTCEAQCYWCNTPVSIPVKLTEPVPDQPVLFVLGKRR